MEVRGVSDTRYQVVAPINPFSPTRLLWPQSPGPRHAHNPAKRGSWRYPSCESSREPAITAKGPPNSHARAKLPDELPFSLMLYIARSMQHIRHTDSTGTYLSPSIGLAA